MRQLIVDTETTGLDPKTGHRIVEFAALEMIDRKLTGNSLQLYINPERNIDDEVAKIHGITNKMVADKPTFSEVVKDIIAYIAGAELIIHNAKFDLSFLDYQFTLEEKGVAEDYALGIIDTLVMARRKFPGGKNNLNALCDRFDINRSHREYHGALVDCRLLADVYLALTREQISLLGDSDQMDSGGEVQFQQIDVSKLNLKVIHATATETEEHTTYLKKLDKASKGDCLWFNATKGKLHAG
jgi:DNA polymerase III subunit epsilon